MAAASRSSAASATGDTSRTADPLARCMHVVCTCKGWCGEGGVGAGGYYTWRALAGKLRRRLWREDEDGNVLDAGRAVPLSGRVRWEHRHKRH